MANPETTRKAERFEAAQRLAPEAFRDAIARYSSDVEGALIFFSHAIGLGFAEPTEADISWAQEVMARHGR